MFAYKRCQSCQIRPVWRQERLGTITKAPRLASVTIASVGSVFLSECLMEPILAQRHHSALRPFYDLRLCPLLSSNCLVRKLAALQCTALWQWTQIV